MSSTKSPIQKLIEQGQSVWLDMIRRDMLRNGTLQRQVTVDGLRGETSNPAIFEKAISQGADYDAQLGELFRRSDLEVKGIYEELAIRDIQDAADIFRPVYETSNGRDGFVSLEVSPYLAFDTQGTIEEARRLWGRVDRPNLMIKVPGTQAGVPAIERLISEGINVNVTLLFAIDMYQAVAEAYLRGLEQRASQGLPIDRIASVASFFVSRIDTLADKKLEAAIASAASTGDEKKKKTASALLGKIAIANAKLAYAWYQEMVASDRWTALHAEGAGPQRLLWASTSTKNPKYRDVVYVEELIGRDTVNTLPPATFEAFLDHGEVRPTLTEGVAEAREQLAQLESIGIRLRDITDTVLSEAVDLFSDPFDKLLGSLERKRQSWIGDKLNAQRLDLPCELEKGVTEAAERWRLAGNTRRLWQGDAALWTGKDEAKWLGWLKLIPEQLARSGDWDGLSAKFRRAGLRDVVLLGMGGSSLAPEVIETLFDADDEFPTFHVLDSTDPAQISGLEAKLDLSRSGFVVSSKSGTTLEPNIFFEYFYDRVKLALGNDAEAATRFLAITDPGSALEKLARDKGFSAVYHGVPSVGGRYSALSDFGLVPAAILGCNVNEVLERARLMYSACGEFVPPAENPGVLLGLILGTLAKQGRDKVTFITSPEIWDVGSWLEQLIAESTGKSGKGLIPIAEEEVGMPSVYGNDRVFVYLKLEGSFDADLDAKVESLRAAGQPLVTQHINGPLSIGQEFFRWEIATAVAGALLGINPFDQPDVEASKQATRRLTAEYEKSGKLPSESPRWESPELAVFSDDANARALGLGSGGGAPAGALRAHLDRLGNGDYFALLAYLDMSLANEMLVQDIRHLIRDTKRVATCVGFGPRFLHSTGQLYKGGPASGVFLQITCDDPKDLPIPGRNLTFGVVKAAQARGDFEVLAERHRRVLRVHLGKNVEAGLIQLKALISSALEGEWEKEGTVSKQGRVS